MTTPDTHRGSDQAALVDRVREVLARADGFDFESLEPHDYQIQAAALLAVLPAPVDRAAVLREAASFYERLLADMGSATECDPRYWRAIQRVAVELRRMAAEVPATEEQPLRCAAAVLNRPHGPHRWEPQPDMDPVRCPGACRCKHPEDEHSVYGCADGCACEYLPARPAVVQPAQPHNDETPRIVGYRSPGGHHLYCTLHAYELASYWPAVTAEDLPDGGVCARCGVDVLIPQEA